MSTKPKKPKARRMCTRGAISRTELPSDAKYAPFCVWGKNFAGEHDLPVAVLDVSDEAALIEVATNAYLEACSKREPTSMAMRAALTALGVLPKRKAK